MSHVMLAMPHNGNVAFGAAEGVFRPSRQHDIILANHQTSLLALGFNTLLCQAMNAYEKGEITHLAFLHADVAPESWWIDKLMDVIEEKEADFVSVVTPIKDSRGLTSTAIGLPDEPWYPMRRLTMHEVHQFPETFDAKDIGYEDEILLHNSGCWIADLRSDIFRQTNEDGSLCAHFTLRDLVAKVDGEWRAYSESEDWFFSRRLHELGARTFATRAVMLNHVGNFHFPNHMPWGTNSADFDSSERWLEHEQDRYIHENGYWSSEMMPFHVHDEGLADGLLDVVELGETVFDLGCGKGEYVKHLNQNGRRAIGLEGTPGIGSISQCIEVDLTDEVKVGNVFGEYGIPDWTFCFEVGEHIPADKDGLLVEAIASCRKGAIVSWAVPGQYGQGHINCQSKQSVICRLEKFGLFYDSETSSDLRETSETDWGQNNLLVFRQKEN